MPNRWGNAGVAINRMLISDTKVETTTTKKLKKQSELTQITTLSSPRPAFCRHNGTVRPSFDTKTA